jgi:ABC-type sugar transport system permease subunit
MNEPRHSSASAGNGFVLRLVLGLLLLLPAILVYREVQLLPALRTIEMSWQDVSILRSGESEYIGSANYDAMFSEPTFGAAVLYTLMIVGVRFLIVAVIPPLVGLLIGTQQQGGRMVNRVFLAIIGVMISPVVLAVLWWLFTSQMWGREPSPLTPLPEWMMLGTPGGARASVIFLDTIVTMGMAAAMGGAAFIAAIRGRAVSAFSNRAMLGVWILGLLLALASLPATFDMPFILTNGGPARATTTLALTLYQQSFVYMRMGSGAAEAVLFILFAVVLACLIWLTITGLRLRLIYLSKRQSEQDVSERGDSSNMMSIISIPLLILIGLTSLALIIWALWLSQSNQAASDARAEVDFGQTFMNTITGPWTAIWLIQIPVTYLAGLSLGFLKPINRAASHVLFLILLVIAFIPAEALMMQWFMIGREAGVLNTLDMVGFAWRAGALSLIVFKLFFDGAAEKFNAARETGETTNTAFMNTVFLPSLPIVVLVGAILSFISAQSLLWPLLSVMDREMLGVPAQLVQGRGNFVTDQGLFASLALNFMGRMMLIFLPVFALLHIFVLDRLAIVAGPPVDPDLLVEGKQKIKRDVSVDEGDG